MQLFSSYLCTYMLSQDHLELFFGCVRGRNGYNNNPTALQFKYTYRALLINNKLQPGSKGNITMQGNTAPLLVTTSNDNDDRRPQEEEVEEEQQLHRFLDLIPEIQPDEYAQQDITLSEYTKGVITYMAGHVVRQISPKLTCTHCRLALLSLPGETPFNSLTCTKNNGGLVFPSTSVCKVLQLCELLIKCKLERSNNRPLRGVNLVKQLQCDVLRHIVFHGLELFQDHSDHFRESTECYTNLIKMIVRKYGNIRYFHEAKKYTSKVTGQIIRQHCNKVVLFKGQ